MSNLEITQQLPEPTAQDAIDAVHSLANNMHSLVTSETQKVLAALHVLETMMLEHYARQQGQIDEIRASVHSERTARDALEKRVLALEAASADRDTIPSSRALYAAIAAPRVPSVDIPRRPWYRIFW